MEHMNLNDVNMGEKEDQLGYAAMDCCCVE
jgi:hypothetical protein